MTLKCSGCGKEYPEKKAKKFLVKKTLNSKDQKSLVGIRAYKCPKCNQVLLVKK